MNGLNIATAFARVAARVEEAKNSPLGPRNVLDKVVDPDLANASCCVPVRSLDHGFLARVAQFTYQERL